MLLFALLLCAVSCQAGFLYPEVPLTTSITNIHSPTAFSHQTITQIHNKEHELVVKQPPSVNGYLTKTNLINTELISPLDDSSEQLDMKGFTDKTPTVFSSDTHTPAHLTYAARPVVYKMLPIIKSNPFIGYYNSFESSLNIKF